MNFGLTCFAWLLLTVAHGEVSLSERLHPAIYIDFFTRTYYCPIEDVHRVRTQVYVDFMGVINPIDWHMSLSITSIDGEIVASTKLTVCKQDQDLDFYCTRSRNSVYKLTFNQLAKKRFSGKSCHIRYSTWDGNIVTESNEQKYPIIKNGPVEKIAINGQVMNIHKMKASLLDLGRPGVYNVTYFVEGIEWTDNHTLSIIHKSIRVVGVDEVSMKVPFAPITILVVDYNIEGSCRKTSQISLYAPSLNHYSLLDDAAPTTWTGRSVAFVMAIGQIFRVFA